MTLVVRSDAEEAPFWHTDVWRKAGATVLSAQFALRKQACNLWSASQRRRSTLGIARAA